MQDLQHPLIVVVGPTASGKTELAQTLAEAFSAAILSADSMQIYRGMDIGTGKIPVQDRSVAYYGLDLVNPGEPYSAALFQEYGRAVVDKLDTQGTRCIVCGGTGFYIRALVDDFSFPAGEQVGNPVRELYTALFESEGSQAVWDVLLQKDPDSAQIIEPNDTKRVIRALELFEEGESYAQQKKKFSSIAPYYPTVHIGLSIEPDMLVKRIDNRVDEMIEAGLVEEVSRVCAAGFREAITANQAIGYKEIVAYLDGACSLEEAVSQIKIATHQYAKRQRTWLRKESRINWIEASQGITDDVVLQAIELIQTADRGR